MSDKKYRINLFLERLPIKQNKKALKLLPHILGVGRSTFDNYRGIGVDDHQDIPHIAVVKMEQFFGIEPGELLAFDVRVKPITEHADDLTAEDMAKEFGLNK